MQSPPHLTDRKELDVKSDMSKVFHYFYSPFSMSVPLKFTSANVGCKCIKGEMCAVEWSRTLKGL